jgi:hypothetical protein
VKTEARSPLTGDQPPGWDTVKLAAPVVGLMSPLTDELKMAVAACKRLPLTSTDVSPVNPPLGSTSISQFKPTSLEVATESEHPLSCA